MPRIIYVLNASSRKDTGITENLSVSLEPLRFNGGPEIQCLTLDDGPNGISTKRDSDRAAVAVADFIASSHREPTAGAYVVACFSDPGVQAAREFSIKPVFGIGQAGFSVALNHGDRLGLIAVSAGSHIRNRQLLRAYGLEDRLAGLASLDLDYGELQQPARVSDRLATVARGLVRDDGADVLLFAAAGLERYRAALQDVAGVPVIDPTQAAVGLALTATAFAGQGAQA